MAARRVIPDASLDRITRRRSLPGMIWALSTYLYKQFIRWQDSSRRYRYADWIRTVERRLMAQALSGLPGERIHVGVVIAGNDLSRGPVEQTLASLSGQLVDWRGVLLLPEDAPCLRAGWITEIQAREPRLSTLTIPADRFIPAQWAAYIEQLPGDWLAPLASGERLAPQWGELLGRTLQRSPQADVIYWDEDRLDGSGQRRCPVFKPDWSPERLYARNDLGSAAFRRDLLLACPRRAAPGWLFSASAAARTVVHLPFVLAHRPISASREDREVHVSAVRDHLESSGYDAVEVRVDERDLLRACWQNGQPLVSIIIPTRNNLEYLRRCLESLLAKTRYPRYEIVLMDDHSSDPDVLAYYQAMLAKHSCLRLRHNADAFNYSRVNNQGARLAQGELLLFLNNDVEILDEDWLAELVRWVQMPGVGMAGAKLLYPDGLIQHAGIVIGMTGHANHVFAGDCPLQNELVYSADWYRNVSAVTGACMLVRREVFEQVGGFDEELSLVFNDVELCQRVTGAGWRIVYTPAACLIHYEGRSRARYIPPANIRRAAELLKVSVAQGDPYYSPNLSLAVHWPTFRRAGDPDPLRQLYAIVRYKGN